jgi:hypothetical protein
MKLEVGTFRVRLLEDVLMEFLIKKIERLEGTWRNRRRIYFQTLAVGGKI